MSQTAPRLSLVPWGQWTDGWGAAASSGSLRHVQLGDRPVFRGFQSVEHAVLTATTGIAIELPFLIASLGAGPVGWQAVGAAPMHVARSLPAEPPPGCSERDWKLGCHTLSELPAAAPGDLLAALASALGESAAPPLWSPGRRRIASALLGHQERLLLEGQYRLALRRAAFGPLVFRQVWQELFSALGADDPGPAGGGLRLRPSRVPRYLAAWLLRSAGFGSQAIGYLLAALGLASVPENLHDDPRRGRRRLNTDAVRALKFWRTLAQAGEATSGREVDIGYAPLRLLRTFLHAVYDERTSPAAGHELLAQGLRLRARLEAHRAAASRAAATAARSQPRLAEERAAVAILERQLRASLTVPRLRLGPPAARAAAFRRLVAQEGATAGGLAHRLETHPQRGWDCAAWLLEEVPYREARRRSGNAIDSGSTGKEEPIEALVPLAPPTGVWTEEWWQVARRVVLSAQSEDLLVDELAAAVGHAEWGARPSRPYELLEMLATSCWRRLDAERRERSKRNGRLEADTAWSQAHEAVFRGGRRRPHDLASALAAWSLRKVGLTLSQVGLGLVLLNRERSPADLLRHGRTAAAVSSTSTNTPRGGVKLASTRDRREQQRRAFADLGRRRLECWRGPAAPPDGGGAADAPSLLLASLLEGGPSRAPWSERVLPTRSAPD